jgi:ArsR family metal-binding transcriptional regulator
MSRKYDVKTLRPCVGGGLVIEAHFEKAFSMETLCKLLEGIAQCSEKLGVARFSHEGCTFTLYRSGRIDVQRAQSEDEAIRSIDDIKPIVEAAFVKKPSPLF